ncbi:MDR family MFS transporter [Nocardioides dubius]|uniref:DHA2 family efflux MFS transporter permease subunit n=1 Tax=Nocardioides dubius TaxID=317019 RepID=A0ABP4E616_9ACTN
MTSIAPDADVPVAPSPDHAAATHLPPGAARLIALLVGSAFVVILNETVMGVALRPLMDEFGVSASAGQWLTTGFLLTMAVVIPTTGWLMARLSLRTIFIIAMSAFTLGTLLAALAPVFGVLVLARVVQAVGTALMMPLLMTTIMTIVPAAKRGQMMGVVSIVISVAPAVGPTISGVILDQLSWRWMFWLVLPIAVLSLTLGSLWVRNVSEPRPAHLDPFSVLLSVLAFGGLIWGLSLIGESAGAHDPMVSPWLPIVIGAVALAVFVWRQLRLKGEALLDLRAFSSGSFALAVLLVCASMMALFGTLILLPLYLQDVLDLTTLETGLLMLPGGLVMGLLAPVVGMLFDKVGPRPLVAPGALLAAVALFLMTGLDAGTGQGEIVLYHVILHIGLAFTFTPLMTSALGSLPPHLYSHGSAIISTAQQVAGAAGTALFITLMTRGTTASLESGETDPVIAFADGVHTAFVWGACISAIAVVIALFVRKPRPVEV